MSADRDRAEAVLADVLTTSARDILRYLESRIGPDDAPDALSDVLVTAWRRCSDLPADGRDARLWLFGIARKTILNVRRGNLRRSNLAHQLRRHVDREHHHGADTGIEVRDAIDRLEPDLSELVRTIHWDGFTLAEAARLLEIPASTAASRYRRAAGLLREALVPVTNRSASTSVGRTTREDRQHPARPRPYPAPSG